MASRVHEALGLTPAPPKPDVWCVIVIPAPGRWKERLRNVKVILSLYSEYEAGVGYMRLYLKQINPPQTKKQEER